MSAKRWAAGHKLTDFGAFVGSKKSRRPHLRQRVADRGASSDILKVGDDVTPRSSVNPKNAGSACRSSAWVRAKARQLRDLCRREIGKTSMGDILGKSSSCSGWRQRRRSPITTTTAENSGLRPDLARSQPSFTNASNPLYLITVLRFNENSDLNQTVVLVSL